MTETKTPKLKVFLCHSKHDKSVVRDLYERLKSEGWIEPWFDEENLLPGQDWDLEIEKAVEDTDAVLVFLSNNSVSKEGYVQRELRIILRISDYKPEGAVFTIPLRLDDCPLPRRMSMWQYVDYFPKERQDWAYNRLLLSLRARAQKTGIDTETLLAEKEERREFELAEKNRREKEAKARKERAERKRDKEIAVEKKHQEKIERDKHEVEEKARLATLRVVHQQERIENIKKFFVTGHPPAGSSMFFALLLEIIVVPHINFFARQPAGGWGVTNYSFSLVWGNDLFILLVG